ncbi:MAG: MBL fold metallo-hydrolase [Sedimentisphaerales bacterium]
MNMLHISNHSKILPSTDNVIIFWLGGAGFLIKYSGGFSVCVDPYLSDSAERLCGFKRLHPTPINADDLRLDVLFITHDHPDHLDEDSFDALMNNNACCNIFAPICCDGFLKSKKRAYNMIKPGDYLSAGDLSVKVTKADHGNLSPFAVGYVFEKLGHTIYFTGDTGNNEAIFEVAINCKPDIVLPCINGAYGNLNEQQAAQLVARCNPTHTIPMHFGLFKEHGGDAKKFAAIVKNLSVKTKVHILAPGDGIEI